MKITYLAIVVFYFPLLVFAGDISADTTKILKTRSYWISATFTFTPQKNLVPIVQKKWRINDDRLEEITSNSVRILPSGKKEWMGEVIRLADQLPFDRIATMPMVNPTLRRLPKGAFSLSTSGITVLFRPANSDIAQLPNTKGSFAHMWAPVAASFTDLGLQSPFDPLPETPHARRTALRHNLSKKRTVHLNASFPRSLLASVMSAIGEWNIALGKNFYRLGDVSTNRTEADCLTSDDLCIFWQGPETFELFFLEWANYGGMSSILYDPAVGYIYGGVISVYNLSSHMPAHVPSGELVSQLNDLDTGPFTAGWVWAQPDYRMYKNPDPIGSITALLVHEMGHDHGFRHYFGGSLHAEPGIPSDTVMDYMPYPFFNKMQRLGARDLAKIGALYFEGDFGSHFSPEMPCADREVLENPLCNPQDIGDPAIFYSSIVQSLGPFHEIKPTGGISGVFTGPQPAVNFAARYLVPNPNVTTMQRMFVEQTLCSSTEQSKIEDHLLKLPSPVRLHCDRYLH